jgi:hypothetical protein
MNERGIADDTPPARVQDLLGEQHLRTMFGDDWETKDGADVIREAKIAARVAEKRAATAEDAAARAAEEAAAEASSTAD